MGCVEGSTYEALYWLYRSFDDGKLDRSYCLKRKQEINRAYRHGCALVEMFEECTRRELAIRNLSSDIEKHGSEDAKRLLRIMDGRERIL